MNGSTDSQQTVLTQCLMQVYGDDALPGSEPTFRDLLERIAKADRTDDAAQGDPDTQDE